MIPGAVVFFGIWFLLLTGRAGARSLSASRRIGLLLLGWLVWGLGNLAVWRFVYRALYDLTRPCETVVGQVVQMVRTGSGSGDSDSRPTYAVAVDDGRGDVAVRYSIGAATFAELRFGSWVRLQVTPKLRHARTAEVAPDEEPMEFE